MTVVVNWFSRWCFRGGVQLTLGSLVASVTVVVNWFSRWCFRGGVQLTLGSLVAAVTVVVLVWMSVRGGAGLVSSAFEVGTCGVG